MEALPSINEIKEFISKHERFTLICHISPDGDTLGSAFALSGILRKMGKTTEVVCMDAAPKAFLTFLPYVEELKTPDNAAQYSSVITVDCADLRRTGNAAALFEKAEHTLNIDHHATNTMYADINSVVGNAAATGELMYELCNALNVELDIEIATCIYTAIMTDTGNFSYSSTSEKTFLIAARLRALGVDTYNVNRLIYRSVPYAKLKLTALTINRIQLKANGKLAYAVLTAEEMANAGAKDENVEGLIDNIRDIDTVELAALIHEKSDGTYKVSLRSKTYIDVAKIAASMGGGGHARAAGYTASSQNAKEAEEEFLNAAEQEFNGEF